MSDFDVKEKRFEQDIEDYLIHFGGYTKGEPSDFNRASGLDEGTFIEFVKTSQPKQWDRFVKIYDAAAEKQLIDRFSREVKQTSLLNVLRHGFTDRGIKFRAVFWKPETSLNETSRIQYEANILHCTRQLHYSLKNENSIDIVLFLNGIPVVSMELKCQFTGQSTTNAINQYKFDRAGKDAIFAFKERVLVHFAVDLTNVYMTTRLEGVHTYFLPFNQGSAGAGNVGGKGNPNNPDGYDTAYLWESVLCKDRLLEILQKYMHLQQEYDKKGNLVKETMIFPRYHQLDVVTKLLADVKENGSGKNYLIQHSAGSGKSNSIAWLAHRLSGLHNDMDEKIFQSVIIVTDRRVLDSQLQSTVYQFDHVEGVVQKIDKNSQQLKDAIENGAGIIITTLQKFPVIYKEVNAANKRFAIIVDEAHSSQTGDAAKKLKRALADTEEILKEYAEMEEEDEKNRKDDEDRLLDELASQGIHKNLSFFAFTATPKGKTLQMFGQKDPSDPEGKRYRPFHVYSMRQAIEEHFILDVLQNYMTYKMYYKIATVEFPGVTSDKTIMVSPFNSKQEHTLCEKIEFTDLEILQLSEFYELTAKEGEDEIHRIIMIPTIGFPEDRESAVVNSIVKDRASFVEYIAFVLGDDYLASMLEKKQIGESGIFQHSNDAMPVLYEKMLKTSVEEPERFRDIGYVLKMVTDKEIIPDEFRELYDTFCNTLKIRR